MVEPMSAEKLAELREVAHDSLFECNMYPNDDIAAVLAEVERLTMEYAALETDRDLLIGELDIAGAALARVKEYAELGLRFALPVHGEGIRKTHQEYLRLLDGADHD